MNTFPVVAFWASLLCINSAVQNEAVLAADRDEVIRTIERYERGFDRYQQQKASLNSQEERSRLRSKLLPDLKQADSERLVEWASENREDPIALEALSLVCDHGQFTPAAFEAAEEIAEHHLDTDGEKFRQLVMTLLDTPPHVAETCFDAFADQAEDATTRGVACLMLGTYKAQLVSYMQALGTPLSTQIDSRMIPYLEKLDPVVEIKNAKAILNRAISDYGKIELEIGPDRKIPLAAMAERTIQQIEQILDTNLIGKESPQIDGKDVFGEELQLKNFRGKVVVVNFWSTNCAPCLRMIPEEKQLLENFQDESFAILGINLDQDSESARETIEKHGIIWPNWWFPAEERESLLQAWKVQFRPTVYVLDQKGVVRHAHLRGKSLEYAIEELLNPETSDVSKGR